MEENDSIEISATHGEHVPSDESNLIYQCAKRVYDICGKPMPGLKLIEDCAFRRRADWVPPRRARLPVSSAPMPCWATRCIRKTS